jgi:hypothetical protein
MANSLKANFDRWSTEAVENSARRVAVLGTGVGLVILGIVLVAVSGDTRTYHVYSCDYATGQCNWSTQHPAILASLGHLGGLLAIAIGGLMLISFGIKMYKKISAGSSEVSRSEPASYASSPASPTSPAPDTTPASNPGPIRSTRIAEAGEPAGPELASPPGGSQPAPRLKGKMIHGSTRDPGQQS